MDVLLETFEYLLDADYIMKRGGLYLVLIILFIETGIIIGFFLPGDPLLFISGMLIASATETPYPMENKLANLVFWEVLFITSTVLGYYFGYWFGKKFKHLFQKRKKESWLFKESRIQSATDFYDKNGGFAIIIARFLPIVRTFVPIVGGIVEMNLRSFTIYNLTGAVLWVGSIVTTGYFLGNIPFVKENVEWIILGIVLLVTLPVLFKFVFSRKKTSTP